MARSLRWTGHAAGWAGRNICLDRPGQGLIRAAGSLGWSFPAALGAKCADRERPVVCFTGDGGFYYHLAEMETALRYGINTVTVVNNNHSFNQEMILWWHQAAYEKNWKFSPVNFAAVAETFGLKSYSVERVAIDSPTTRSRSADERGHQLKIGGEARPLASHTTSGLFQDPCYRTVITSPLRSAATISPTWRPDTVSNAPFWLVSRIAPPPGPIAAPAPAAT
jgi:hypothetical protein